MVWTTTIYPLRLARANALDILAAQPEGPYLLGGHSYGGAVAAEVLVGNGINDFMAKLHCFAFD